MNLESLGEGVRSLEGGQEGQRVEGTKSLEGVKRGSSLEEGVKQEDSSQDNNQFL